MTRLLYGLLPCFILLTHAPPSRGGFIDSFEAATLNPFWSVHTQSGSLTVPSNAQAHTGTRSAQFNSTSSALHKEIQLFHTFPQPVFGKVSVWVYDTGADVFSSNYLFLTLDNSVLGMRSDIGTQDYDLGPGIGGDVYYYRNWVDYNQQPSRSSIDRTRTWHEWAIDTQPGSLSISIDGSTVYSGSDGKPFDSVSLSMFGPSWRPAWVGYFDDFQFVEAGPNPVPVPPSLAMAILGGLTLLGYGWRRVEFNL